MSKSNFSLFSICILSVSLFACSSIALNPAAANVYVAPSSSQQIPYGCKYLGQVTGSQGNFFTGTYTSNSKLAAGAMNDLRNQTQKIGGNYVQLMTNQASTTGSGGLLGDGLQQTGVVNTGNVYNCPESSLPMM